MQISFANVLFLYIIILSRKGKSKGIEEFVKAFKKMLGKNLDSDFDMQKTTGRKK